MNKLQKLTDKIDSLLGGEILNRNVYASICSAHKKRVSKCKACMVTVDISLEDVLRAIRESGKGILVDNNGILYTVDTIKALNIGCAWILGKTLSQQSDATKEALWEIIK